MTERVKLTEAGRIAALHAELMAAWEVLAERPSPPNPQARIEALTKALEPFADCGEMLVSETSGFQDHDELVLFTDDSEPHSQRCELIRFKFGAFITARAALNQGADQ